MNSSNTREVTVTLSEENVLKAVSSTVFTLVRMHRFRWALAHVIHVVRIARTRLKQPHTETTSHNKSLLLVAFVFFGHRQSASQLVFKKASQ